MPGGLDAVVRCHRSTILSALPLRIRICSELSMDYLLLLSWGGRLGDEFTSQTHTSYW